jgi:MazG family protein
MTTAPRCDPATLPEAGFDRLVAVMAALRDEAHGCPWDREQTLASLRAFLVEESYEAIDAIDALGPAARASAGTPVTADPDAIAAHREELGDVLLQIAFQSRIAEENGWYTADDVARGIADKMVRRHPHVFATPDAAPAAGALDAAAVVQRWEAQKRREGRGALDGVPRSLPALLRAQRVGEKAGRIGFDWQTTEGVLAKVDEELEELRGALDSGDRGAIEHELGDLLMTIASLARHVEVDAESCLRETLDRFTRRFVQVEAAARVESSQVV